MQSIGLKATSTEQTGRPNDRRKLHGSRIRDPQRRFPKSEIHFCHKIQWFKDLYSISTQDVRQIYTPCTTETSWCFLPSKISNTYSGERFN